MSKSKSNTASALVPTPPASTSRVARTKGDAGSLRSAKTGKSANAGDALLRDGEVEDDAPSSSPASALVEPETDSLDEEFDLGEAVAAELEVVEPVKPAPHKRADEGGGDSMLSRYFREMATHHVMGPQEELATAIEVEQGEIDHWVAIFSCIPVAGFALDALERDLPVGEDALVLPFVEGFFASLGKAVVDGASPILVDAVITAGREKLLGANQAKGVVHIGRHGVLAALAAIQRQQHSAHTRSASLEGQHAAVLIVGMSGNHHQAGAGLQRVQPPR